MRGVAASEEATPLAGTAQAEPVGRLPRLEDAERRAPFIGLGELCASGAGGTPAGDANVPPVASWSPYSAEIGCRVAGPKAFRLPRPLNKQRRRRWRVRVLGKAPPFASPVV